MPRIPSSGCSYAQTDQRPNFLASECCNILHRPLDSVTPNQHTCAIMASQSNFAYYDGMRLQLLTSNHLCPANRRSNPSPLCTPAQITLLILGPNHHSCLPKLRPSIGAGGTLLRNCRAKIRWELGRRGSRGRLDPLAQAAMRGCLWLPAWSLQAVLDPAMRWLSGK